MTDITETNTWEEGIYLLTRDDAVDAGEDGSGVANTQAKQLANRTNWLKQRVGIKGNWDMSGAVTELTPAPAGDIGGTSAIVDANNQTLTPTAPAANVLGSYVSACISALPIRQHGTRWGRLTVPDLSGSNTTLTCLYIGQIGATFEDIFKTLNNIDTDPGDGSYAVILQIVGGAASLVYVSDGSDPVQTLLSSADPDWEMPAAGEDLYLGIDFKTGMIYVDRTGSDGPIAIGAMNLDNEHAGLTAGAAMVFASDTPSFPEGPLNFDLGTSAGGRLPFAQIPDATLPAGAQDAYRYYVEVGGFWRDLETKEGDIVELRNSLADIIVTRYPDPDPVTLDQVREEADARIAATEQPNVRKFIDRREVWGVVNDTPAATGHYVNPKDGDGLIVGASPTGDFAGRSTGDLLVKDGDQWVAVTPWPGMSVYPIVNAAPAPYHEQRFVEWIYLPNYSASWDQGVSADQLDVSGAIDGWYKVRRFSQPLKPLEVDVNDSEAFTIKAEYTKHAFVKALVAGNCQLQFEGGHTHESSGLVILFADTAGGAQVSLTSSDSGDWSFSGFRRSGSASESTMPTLRLDEGESVVLRWVTATDDTAHLVLLGGGDLSERAQEVEVSNAGTTEISEAHHVIRLVTDTAGDIAATTIELPFREVFGAPILLHVENNVAAVTWKNTLGGADSTIAELPARLFAGDAWLLYGGPYSGHGWVAIQVNDGKAALAYKRYYDNTTVTMAEGEEIAHIVETTPNGNHTVKLPPNPTKGQKAYVVKHSANAFDLVVQDSAGGAIETVNLTTDDATVVYFFGEDNGAPSSDVWRRMPAIG